jgi:hypothetical protein
LHLHRPDGSIVSIDANRRENQCGKPRQSVKPLMAECASTGVDRVVPIVRKL